MQWTTRMMAMMAMMAMVAATACGDDGDRGDGGESQATITTAVPTNPTGISDTADSSGTDASASASATGTGSASASSTPTTTDGSTAADATTADPTTAGTTTGALDDTGVPPDTSTADATTDEPIKFDAGQALDIPPPVCLKCALTIASQQSGVLEPSGDHVFATAQLAGQVVYALGTYGAGRFIAAADSSLPFNEQTDCPLAEWLAGNGGVQPKILYFGWGPSDGPKQWNVQSDAAGIHMPAQYIGNPNQLRADYDIVLYLEGSGQFGSDAPSDQEMTTLLDYLQAGGGLYVSSEFYGYLNDADLVSVNRLLNPLGATTKPVSLNWGNVDGQIDFECFPEPQ